MSVIKVLRDIALVKAQVKDEDLRKQLLAPLELELRRIAAESARQGILPLEQSGSDKTPKKG